VWQQSSLCTDDRRSAERNDEVDGAVGSVWQTQAMPPRLQQQLKTASSVECVWHGAVRLSYRCRTTTRTDVVVGVVKRRTLWLGSAVHWAVRTGAQCIMHAVTPSTAIEQQTGDNSWNCGWKGTLMSTLCQLKWAISTNRRLIFICIHHKAGVDKTTTQ